MTNPVVFCGEQTKTGGVGGGWWWWLWVGVAWAGQMWVGVGGRIGSVYILPYPCLLEALCMCSVSFFTINDDVISANIHLQKICMIHIRDS